MPFGDAIPRNDEGAAPPLEPIPVELPPATTFARSPAELVGALAEVSSWN